MIVYAAGGEFPTESKAANLDWLAPMAESHDVPLAMSYQDIATMAGLIDDSPIWSDWRLWVDHKVKTVRGMGRSNIRLID